MIKKKKVSVAGEYLESLRAELLQKGVAEVECVKERGRRPD
ncbi:MAG: hypothetical protein WDO19_32000 [Bacteroidota bacterium]